MIAKKIMTLTMAALILAACAGSGPKQTGGTLIGAGLGGLAGSQIGGGKGKLAAVAIGALAGAWLGGEIGRQLDARDRQMAAQTAQTSLETAPTGSTSTWHNPDSGHSGTITPIKTYEPAQTTTGEPCREYETTVVIGGQTERAYGTACRQADGSWKIKN